MLNNLYSNIILKYPKKVLLLTITIIIILGSFALRLDIDASAQTLLVDGDKDLAFSRKMSNRYKAPDFLVVTFTPKTDLLSKQSINTIKQLSKDLNSIDFVDNTTSIINVPLLQSPPKPLQELLKKIPTLLSKDTNLSLAKKEFLNSAIYKNNLVSDDFKTTAILVNLKPDLKYKNFLEKKKTITSPKQLKKFNKEFKQYRDIRREYIHKNIIKIREVLAKYKKDATLHLGGVDMIADDMVNFVRSDLETFSYVVFALMIIILYILLKEIKWVYIPIFICVVSIIATSGILGLFGWEITVISSNFISLQLIMTMSLVVHLMIKYRELLLNNPNLEQKELVFQTVTSMAKPSFFVVITTIAGFSSLVFSSILPVMNFGWMMSMGIAISLVLTFILFPTILILLPKKYLTIPKQNKTPFTAHISNIAINYKKTIIILSLIVVYFSLTGANRLFVENSFINYFKQNTEIYKGMKLIDQKLGGTTPLDIIITFKDEPKTIKDTEATSSDDELDSFDDEFTDDSSDTTYWFTKAKMDKIRKISNYLDSLPQIGKVISLATLDEVGKVLNDGKYLDSFELALLNKKLPQKYKKILLSPYVDIEANQIRISTRIIDSLPNLRRDKLIKKIDHDLSEMLNPKYETYKLTNLLILYDNMLQSLFHSQIETLGVVVVILFLMFLLLFRNIIIAILALIANIVPVGVIFGFMGWMHIPLDMMTITIAAISMGIAVDDTIHYIHRFKDEYNKTKDYTLALKNSHKSIGTAMFYTSVIIMVGFSVLMLSNFIPTIYFGILTLIAMFMAIIADLLLMPVLLLIFKPLKDKNL